MQDHAHHDDDEMDAKTEWAERRTDWAEDRTVLANERTFAGWMRTGMGGVAVAIGLQAVFGEVEPWWLPRAAASVFILAGMVAFWTSAVNARKTHRRLDDHTAQPLSGNYFLLIAGVLSLGAVACGYILWQL